MGNADIAAGRTKPYQEVFARLRAKGQAMKDGVSE
jgi:hypothetical protein